MKGIYSHYSAIKKFFNYHYYIYTPFLLSISSTVSLFMVSNRIYSLNFK